MKSSRMDRKSLFLILFTCACLAALSSAVWALGSGEDESSTDKLEAVPGAQDWSAGSWTSTTDKAPPADEAPWSPSDDVQPASHDMPPPGETNCSCFYQWECRSDGRYYRLECCTCDGGFGCSSHWERTNYPC